VEAATATIAFMNVVRLSFTLMSLVAMMACGDISAAIRVLTVASRRAIDTVELHRLDFRSYITSIDLEQLFRVWSVCNA